METAIVADRNFLTDGCVIHSNEMNRVMVEL
jgi:hypothetical protein